MELLRLRRHFLPDRVIWSSPESSAIFFNPMWRSFTRVDWRSLYDDHTMGCQEQFHVDTRKFREDEPLDLIP